MTQLPPQCVPRATYRVQLHRDFTFAQLTELVPYLAALGISHVYCSPYLRARPGSRHGYDVVDHRMLNPEIGTTEDFARLVDALSRHGMSHLCDVVPNHIAIMGDDNPWWMDVLENGPASTYAAFFDIDWMPRDPDLAGKVLVPVLGEPYGTVLERGEIVLAFEEDDGAFVVRYFEHRFPLDPRTYADILLAALPGARAQGALRPIIAEVERVAYTLKALPSRDEQAPARIHVRRHEAGALKQCLAQLVAGNPLLGQALAGAVARINGTPGEASSFETLHALLEAQAFRLAHWRVASDEVNYRRFFDINGLAALRMENEAAFDATHDFILDLAADGVVGGLRIDHPDGLLDPAGYFARLQQRYRERSARRSVARSGAAPERAGAIYVVVEKITASHERLPQQWPVHGTTGYRFANVVNGLFVDTKARARVDRTWRAFVGAEAHTFEEASYRGRRVVMEGSLASQLTALALRALRIARADRRTRDFTLNALRAAIVEIVARFPVYRTYVDADGASEQDRRYVDWAVGRARARSLVSDPMCFDFLKSIMLGARPEGAERITAESCREFAMRFQQFTAPVTAKGVEDTAFYTFNRLVSLNEVGGDPDRFGITVRAFHAASTDRAAHWPHTMVATSTHDSKRSEDVRARIDIISEMPAAWRLLVRRWSRMNRSRKHDVDGDAAPSRNDEYLLYQTLAGSFPPGDPDGAAIDRYRERVQEYMVKAGREAKLRTSWLAINKPYEDAVTGFVADLLRTDTDNRFLDDLREHATTFAWFGMLNSLSMALLKLASPGVPDIYQGNEILDWSLVDPDNRRPVDYEVRRALLASFAASSGAPRGLSLFESPYDGRAKLWVTAQALALRRQHPALFAAGEYRRVAVKGARENHVVAFRRVSPKGRPEGEQAPKRVSAKGKQMSPKGRPGDEQVPRRSSAERRSTSAEDGVLVVAGRFFASLGAPRGALPVGELWGDTKADVSFLPPGTPVENVLTGETLVVDGDTLDIATLFREFPGALVRFVTGNAGEASRHSIPGH